MWRKFKTLNYSVSSDSAKITVGEITISYITFTPMKCMNLTTNSLF